MSERLLVTGAGGFAGGEIATKLCRSSETHLVSLKTPCARELADIASGVHRLDLTDKQAVDSLIASLRPAVCIHAAALADAKACEEDTRLAFLSNVQATENLVHALERHSPEAFFVYLSTDLVFDGYEDAPESGFEELSVPKPQSVYAATKHEAERRVMSSGLNAASIRISLLYGAPLGEKAGFLRWMHEALCAKKPLTLFTDEYRTPLYIRDLSSAITRLVERSSTGTGEKTKNLYHLGGPERLSRYDFGLELCRAFGYDPALVIGKTRGEVQSVPKRPKDVSLNSALLTEKLSLACLPPRAALDDIRRETGGDTSGKLA